MSDTPRTMARIAELEHLPEGFRAAGLALFCFNLECELNAAREKALEEAATVCDEHFARYEHGGTFDGHVGEQGIDWHFASTQCAKAIRALLAVPGNSPENATAQIDKELS